MTDSGQRASFDEVIESLLDLARSIDDGKIPEFALVIIGDETRPTSIVSCSDGDTYMRASHILQLVAAPQANTRPA